MAAVLDAARRWADEDARIRAIALVGSWARGVARADSDVDLLVLATDVEVLLDDRAWFGRFGLGLVGARDFGAIQERRIRRASGLEVEIGIGDPSWASTDPLDEGTRRVASDGLRIVADPDGLLARLSRALRAS